MAYHLTVKLSSFQNVNDKYSCQFVGSVICTKYMVDLSIVLPWVQAKQALLFCSLQYVIVLMSVTACRQGEMGM